MTADRPSPHDGPTPATLDGLNDLWDALATDDDGRATGGTDQLGSTRAMGRMGKIGPPRRRARPKPVDRTYVQTIRALGGADDTPDPDPRFLRDLRSTLMDTSNTAATGAILAPALPPIAIPDPDRSNRLPGRTPARPGPVRRLPGATMRALEIAAVAALLLTMLGFAAGDRGADGIRALLTARQDDPPPAAMYLGDAAHTGEMPGPGPDATAGVGLLWRAPAAGVTWTPDSAPVVADGILYLTTRTTDPETRAIQTGLAVLDLRSGTPLWEIPLPGFIRDATNGSPVIADGIVYVGMSLERWLGGTPATPEANATPETTAYMAGAVLALDAQTGQQLWTYDDLPRAGNHAPVLAGGALYVVSEDGTLHALDATTGEPRWTAFPSDDPRAGFATAPSISGDTLYVSSYLGQLHALDVENGAERWTAPIGPNLPTIASVADDTVFVGTISNASYEVGGGFTIDATPDATPATPDGGKHLFAFDAGTGAERWSFDPGGVLGGASTVAGDTLLVTGAGKASNEVVALAASDGAERWRASTDGRIITPAVWSGETVYAGSFDSTLSALDLATGAIQWQVATGGGIASPAFVADGIVAFTSFDGNVYAVSAAVPASSTPTAGGAPANDISGLPPCTITPRPAWEPSADGTLFAPEGTPATASLRPTDDPDYEGTSNILFTDAPQGEPAPQDVVDDIRATIAEMAACDRPGYENHLAAHFSDDYFRRNPLVDHPGSDLYGYVQVPGDFYGNEGTPFERATILPDGRVATVFRVSITTNDPDDDDGVAEYGSLVVWVEIDGRWLVDESVQLGEELGRG